jgi:hypothetical protein
MGWTLGAGYQIFGKSGFHRFENSWASPAGSHQPVVTCDLQCAKRQIEFSFFPIKKIRTNIKLAKFQLKIKNFKEYFINIRIKLCSVRKIRI